jgi:cell wall-associated NlpC family hydrolase
MSVSLSVLSECFDHTKGRVGYRLGAKPSLGSDSATFSEADCSGWVRWACDRAGLRIPDGSANQWEWAKANLRQVNYADVGKFCAADPSRLFIAFMSAARSGIGHVWLGRSDGKQMRTMECHGGQRNRGVDSLPWSVRQAICDGCYELPAAA